LGARIVKCLKMSPPMIDHLIMHEVNSAWVAKSKRADACHFPMPGPKPGPKKGPSPGPSWAQARFLEIWKFGNWKSGKLRSKKIQKITILKIKIRSAQNVGKVWISRKKSSWPHLGPSGPIFCVGRENPKNVKCLLIFLGGPMGPPLWSPPMIDHLIVHEVNPAWVMKSKRADACHFPIACGCQWTKVVSSSSQKQYEVYL